MAIADWGETTKIYTLLYFRFGSGVFRNFSDMTPDIFRVIASDAKKLSLCKG